MRSSASSLSALSSARSRDIWSRYPPMSSHRRSSVASRIASMPGITPCAGGPTTRRRGFVTGFGRMSSCGLRGLPGFPFFGAAFFFFAMCLSVFDAEDLQRFGYAANDWIWRQLTLEPLLRRERSVPTLHFDWQPSALAHAVPRLHAEELEARTQLRQSREHLERDDVPRSIREQVCLAFAADFVGDETDRVVNGDDVVLDVVPPCPVSHRAP